MDIAPLEPSVQNSSEFQRGSKGVRVGCQNGAILYVCTSSLACGMNELALTRAVEDGSLSTVETLLAADCADVNIVSTDGGASTALHVAASYGQDAIASVLLQRERPQIGSITSDTPHSCGQPYWVT